MKARGAAGKLRLGEEGEQVSWYKQMGSPVPMDVEEGASHQGSHRKPPGGGGMGRQPSKTPGF